VIDEWPTSVCRPSGLEVTRSAVAGTIRLARGVPAFVQADRPELRLTPAPASPGHDRRGVEGTVALRPEGSPDRLGERHAMLQQLGRCCMRRTSAALAVQGSGQPEMGEHPAVAEPGDGGDLSTLERKHHHSVRTGDRRLGIGEVATECGLAIGGGRLSIPGALSNTSSFRLDRRPEPQIWPCSAIPL
jgi:hypothetical protein